MVTVEVVALVAVITNVNSNEGGSTVEGSRAVYLIKKSLQMTPMFLFACCIHILKTGLSNQCFIKK